MPLPEEKFSTVISDNVIRSRFPLMSQAIFLSGAAERCDVHTLMLMSDVYDRANHRKCTFALRLEFSSCIFSRR